MEKAYAPSTVQRYQFRCFAFNAFCKQWRVSDLPAKPRVIGWFLVSIFREGKKPSTVRAYLSAIGWSHKIRDLPDPSRSFMLQKVLAGMANASPAEKRVEPLTWPRLRKVITILPGKVPLYQAIMLKAAFLLAYYASLRVSEFAKSASLAHTIKLDQVAVGKSELTLTLLSFKHSKRPAKITIQADPKREDVCPVRALKNYLAIRTNGSPHLFCLQNGSVLTRALVSKALKSCVKELGLKADDFDTHSFRAGRTTDLVEAGYSDSTIRESGRWASDAYLRYVRFDLFRAPMGSVVN